MKFETKCKKLDICEDVKSLMRECVLYEGESKRIVELHKLRKWEIMEEIGNYLNWIDKNNNEVSFFDFKQLKSFIKAFDIEEDEVAEYYALAICEGGAEIAYAVNDDVVLVLV